MDKQFYTVQELSERWMVNYRTALKEIEDGKVRYIQVGRQIRVSAGALAEYEGSVNYQVLKAQKVKA